MSQDRRSGGGGFRGDRGRGGFRGDRGGGSRGESPYRGGDSRRGSPRSSGHSSRQTSSSERASSMGRGSSASGDYDLEAYGTDGRLPVPDEDVHRSEDSMQQSLSSPPTRDLSDLTALNLEGVQARRPGYGLKGDHVVVWANHFRMHPSNVKLYRYHIQIDPEVRGRKLKRIIQLLLTEGHVSRLGPGLASDYKMILIASEELFGEDLNETISYRFAEEDTASEGAQQYNIELQSTGVLQVSDLMAYLGSEDGYATFDKTGQLIQALNIVIGQYAKSQVESTVASIGANRHYALQGETAESFDISGGLIAWRGYFTSVRNSACRITLNIQVKNAAFYNAVPLSELLDQFRRANGPNLRKLDSFLKRVRVRTTHLPDRTNNRGVVIPRIKTISGLASVNDGSEQPNPPRIDRFGAGPSDVEFFLMDSESTVGSSSDIRPVSSTQGGRYIAIGAYFRQTYSRHVHERLPVVNVGSRRDPVYLPVDVCVVLPGQPAGSKLSAEQTRQMIRFAVRRPNLNAKSIVGNGTNVIGTNPTNPTLARFGISLNTNLLTVPARILPGPNIKYGQNRVAQTRFGSWNMDKIQFVTGTEALNWSFVVVNPQRRPKDYRGVLSAVRAFADELNRSGVSAGVPLGDPGFWVNLQDESIDQFFAKAANESARPRILLVILNTNDSKVYNSIKFAGDITYGIHTVCVLQSKLTQVRRNNQFDIQYFANVALKFNLKLGGANQVLDGIKLGIINAGKTMLIGIDATHPSPNSSQRAASVAGMVCSIDRRCSQFPAVLKIQRPSDEIIQELGFMLKTRLRVWQRHNNGELPENILIYRDGISEGQFDRVLEQELPSMKGACREVYPGTLTNRGLPRLSLVICGKRHHTRFYPTSTAQGKIDVRSANNPNGTIIDRGVTNPRCWDFFLQAHTAPQGTARPAHYYVVYDEIFGQRPLSKEEQEEGCRNQAEVLQDITHNLSYMFGRATKAVSICPPAYYADLLCERARCYLSGFFDPDSEAEPSSAAMSSAGEEGLGPSDDLVEIHPELRDSMFYI